MASDELHVEAAWGDAVVADLRKRSHVVVVDRSLGAAQAVGLGPAGEGFRGSADPGARVPPQDGDGMGRDGVSPSVINSGVGRVEEQTGDRTRDGRN